MQRMCYSVKDKTKRANNVSLIAEIVVVMMRMRMI